MNEDNLQKRNHNVQDDSDEKEIEKPIEKSIGQLMEKALKLMDKAELPILTVDDLRLKIRKNTYSISWDRL